MKPEVGGEGLPVAKTPGVDSNTSAAPLTQQSSIDAVVELYSPDFTHVYSVPRSGIYQMPPARMHITRFCACKNFSNAVLKAVESGNPEMGTEAWYKTACPLDTFCRFVHVARPLSEFPRQAIHVHYIWRSLKEVTYEALEPTLNTGDEPPSSPRLKLVLCHDYRNQILKMREQCSAEEASSPKVYVRDGDVDFHARTEPGAAFMVGVMAAVLPSVRVPATRLLKTAGAVECLRRSQAGESVPELALCLTYLVENECRKGCECPYAHAINLDSSLTTPFVRRTLRQIKKAAISMELVTSDTMSTTPASAGTSRLNTPLLTPRMLSSHQYSCAADGSDDGGTGATTPRTMFDSDLVADQLSLSFDSFVSNSVSEYSVVNQHQSPALTPSATVSDTPQPPLPTSYFQQHFQQQVRSVIAPPPHHPPPPPYLTQYDRPLCMANSGDGRWSGSVSLPLSSSADSMGSNSLQFPPQWAAQHMHHQTHRPQPSTSSRGGSYDHQQQQHHHSWQLKEMER